MFTTIPVFPYESQPHLREREETKYIFTEFREMGVTVMGYLRNC